jgi:hypothetical protein
VRRIAIHEDPVDHHSLRIAMGADFEPWTRNRLAASAPYFLGSSTPPDAEFEKVGDECAVIQDLTAS